LSYLGGNISYLKDEFSSGDELDHQDILESLESAESGYQRIKNIVSDLKVFSAETSLSIAWVPVVDIFDKLQKEFSDIELSFPESLKGLEVETDKDRVAQIIRNLVQNARQAYGDQSSQKILMAFFVDGDRLLISVKDWAGGVAPEVAKNIFEPFFTTKKNVGGAGLGLSVSQNLSREIGGDLMLQSTSNEGSVFCLILKRFRSKV
jgi:C4-dicarboxylate-specific signal transduction histidine kinase